MNEAGSEIRIDFVCRVILTFGAEALVSTAIKPVKTIRSGAKREGENFQIRTTSQTDRQTESFQRNYNNHSHACKQKMSK